MYEYCSRLLTFLTCLPVTRRIKYRPFLAHSALPQLALLLPGTPAHFGSSARNCLELPRCVVLIHSPYKCLGRLLSLVYHVPPPFLLWTYAHSSFIKIQLRHQLWNPRLAHASLDFPTSTVILTGLD